MLLFSVTPLYSYVVGSLQATDPPESSTYSNGVGQPSEPLRLLCARRSAHHQIAVRPRDDLFLRNFARCSMRTAVRNFSHRFRRPCFTPVPLPHATQQPTHCSLTSRVSGITLSSSNHLRLYTCFMRGDLGVTKSILLLL